MQKCLAYKINQITGKEFDFNFNDAFICQKCHSLITKIFFLEKEINENLNKNYPDFKPETKREN